MLHAGLELAGKHEGKSISFQGMAPHHQTAIRKILNHKSNMQWLDHDINNRKGLRVRMAMNSTMTEAERHARKLHHWQHVEGDTGYMRKTRGIAAHTAKELDNYLVKNKLIKEGVMHALLETTYQRAGIIRHDEGIVPLAPPPDHSAPSTHTTPHNPPPAQQQHQDAAGNPIQQPIAGPSTEMAKRPGGSITMPARKRRRNRSPSPKT